MLLCVAVVILIDISGWSQSSGEHKYFVSVS